jgi:cytochrome c oxidase assembly protein subunit 15
MTLLHRLVFSVAVLAFCVVVLGAYVRLSNAGLGCPDWPVCYGRLVPPTAAPEIDRANTAFPQRPVEIAKAWKEQAHRYAASTLGLGILLIALLHWRQRGALRPAGLPYVLVVLVIFQGLLGMWTVTLLLKPLVVVLHLLGGMTTLLLLWWITLRNLWHGFVGTGGRALRGHVIVAFTMLALQIASGGWTSSNYAAMACVDFPTCHGTWWPAMDFKEAFVLWRGLGINYEYGVLDAPARVAIHFTHRLGAMLTFAVVGSLAGRCLLSAQPTINRTGAVLAVALLAQIGLGIANVSLGLPLAVAVAHNAGAALLLLIVTTLLHLTTPSEH